MRRGEEFQSERGKQEPHYASPSPLRVKAERIRPIKFPRQTHRTQLASPRGSSPDQLKGAASEIFSSLCEKHFNGWRRRGKGERAVSCSLVFSSGSAQIATNASRMVYTARESYCLLSLACFSACVFCLPGLVIKKKNNKGRESFYSYCVINLLFSYQSGLFRLCRGSRREEFPERRMCSGRLQRGP